MPQKTGSSCESVPLKSKTTARTARIGQPAYCTGSMPASAFALALAAAFLHSFWTLLLARARDSAGATAVALLASVIAFAPVTAVVWRAEAAVWPFIAVTSLLQLLYFALLSAAYGRAELSIVYPIARGVAPVLVLVVGAAALVGGAGRRRLPRRARRRARARAARARRPRRHGLRARDRGDDRRLHARGQAWDPARGPRDIPGAEHAARRARLRGHARGTAGPGADPGRAPARSGRGGNRLLRRLRARARRARARVGRVGRGRAGDERGDRDRRRGPAPARAGRPAAPARRRDRRRGRRARQPRLTRRATQPAAVTSDHPDPRAAPAGREEESDHAPHRGTAPQRQERIRTPSPLPA